MRVGLHENMSNLTQNLSIVCENEEEKQELMDVISRIVLRHAPIGFKVSFKHLRIGHIRIQDGSI